MHGFKVSTLHILSLLLILAACRGQSLNLKVTMLSGVKV